MLRNTPRSIAAVMTPAGYRRPQPSASSVYIRLKLEESPVFQRIKAEGRTSKAPLTESFANWSNAKIVILALLGATAGQGVVWYTGQFYALSFLIITLKLDFQSAYILI